MSTHEAAITTLTARRDELMEKLEENELSGQHYHKKSAYYTKQAQELQDSILALGESIAALGGTITGQVNS